MKAVILAATRSEKLSPFTDTRPKPMLYIAGKYILETTIEFLKSVGIHEILLVVHHQQSKLREYFSYGDRFGVSIEYVEQHSIEGIGHALKLCQPFLKQQNGFLLIYGDVLTDGNIFLNGLNAYSETGEEIAVITLPQASHEFGNVYLDHEMKIRKLIEKPQVGSQANYVFAGVFVLSHRIFELLDANKNNIEPCFQFMIKEKGLQASLWESGWIDIIYPWHILEANKMMMDLWKEARIDTSSILRGRIQIEGPVIIQKNVTIESGTILKGPCFIGENSYIGNNVLIRSYSTLGPNSVVGYGCELKNCVLFGKSDIGRLSFIGDSVIGEKVVIGSGLTTVNRSPQLTSIQCKLPLLGIVDSGLKKLGAFLGDNVFIGARHTLAPGTIVPSNKLIPDHISF